MISPLVGGYVAIMLANKRKQEEQKRKVDENRKIGARLLLVQGGVIDMDINGNEKILSFYVKRTYEYNKKNNSLRKWVLSLEQEYITDTLDEMVMLISKMFHIKGLQMMPMSVTKGNNVDKVIFVIKTDIIDESIMQNYENGLKLDNLGSEW